MNMTPQQHAYSTTFLHHIFSDKISVKPGAKFTTITLKIKDIHVVCRYKVDKISHQSFLVFVPTLCHVFSAMEAMSNIEQSSDQHKAYRKFVIKSLYMTKAQNVLFTYEPENKNARDK